MTGVAGDNEGATDGSTVDSFSFPDEEDEDDPADGFGGTLSGDAWIGTKGDNEGATDGSVVNFAV